MKPESTQDNHPSSHEYESSNDAEFDMVARRLRVGALIIAVYNLSIVFVGPSVGIHVPPPWRDMLIMSAAVAILFGYVSRQEWFLRRWRPLTAAFCALMIALATFPAIANHNSELLQVSLVLFMIGTAAVIPWEPRWQAAVIAASLAAGFFYLHQVGTRFEPAEHSVQLLFAAIIAHVTSSLSASYRGEIARRVDQLARSHDQLRVEMAWRERLAAEREAAQRRVAESETNLRRIFDANPSIIVLHTADDGRILEVNEALRAAGYQRGELIGRTAEQVGAIEGPNWVKEYLKLLRGSGSVKNFDAVLRHRDGALHTYCVSGTLIERDGQLNGVTVLHDVTERRRAESELREAREALTRQVEALRKIFETAVDIAVVSRASDHIIIDVNEGFVTELGLPRDRVIGRTAEELGLWVEPERQREYRSRLAEAGFARNFEAEFRRADGTVAPYLISGTRVALADETCIVSFARDITRLKQTERELVHARQAALAASEAKSEFLSRMSHEIRTPLNTILGMAELLDEADLSSELHHYVGTMISNGGVLLNLINDILDIAKIESGLLSLERSQFDLDDAIDEALSTVAVSAHAKRLELAVRIAPDAPRALIGDCLRLRQILVNLLGNAVKFTEQGEVVLSVARDPSSPAPGALAFSVRDTGIGIAPEKLDTLFAPFVQYDSSTTRKYGGSGLGLTIVQKLVNLMGGRIDVASRPGEGSTFTVAIEFEPACEQPGSHPPPQADLSDIRVLVVDDSATSRKIVAEVLASRGAQVAEAAGGSAALAELKRARRARAPYRLVVLDGRMSGMDGFEVAARARREPGGSEAIVMMLTSDELTPALARLRGLGLGAYVVKPVTRRPLLAEVARVLRDGDRADAGRPGVPSARTRTAAAPVADRPLKILLADDSRDNRELIRAFLSKTPYRVEEAANGLEAVEKFAAGRYDLVLLDIQMPVMNGYEAAHRIREMERERRVAPTPILALTASVLDEAAQRAREAGCDAHVAKPVGKSTLLQAIYDFTSGAPQPPAQPGSNGGKRMSANDRIVVNVDEDLSDLIPGFLERKAKEARAVLAAVDRGDFATVRQIAHRLKGEGGSYGFDAVTEYGRALRDAAAEERTDDVRRIARELSDYLSRVEVNFQPSSDSA